MTIEYTGRQTTLTPALKSQAEVGIQRICRVTDRCTKAHVILTEEKRRRIAEVTLQCRGEVFVATAEASEMDSALRAALDKVEQQAIHHKERHATVRDHTTPLSTAVAT